MDSKAQTRVRTIGWMAATWLVSFVATDPVPATGAQLREPSFIAAEVDSERVVRQWPNRNSGDLRDLNLGDRIVQWEGQVPGSQRELAEWWLSRFRGDRSRVRVERMGQELEIEFTHRGASDYFRLAMAGGRGSFPDPDRLHPEWQKHENPWSPLVLESLGPAAQGEIRDLARAFRKTTDELRDHYLSEHAIYLLNHPFHADVWAKNSLAGWQADAAPSELLAVAGQLADPEARSWTACARDQTQPGTFSEWIAFLESRVAEIDQAYSQAWAGLTPGEQAELAAWTESFQPLRKDDPAWNESLLGLHLAKRVDLVRLQIAWALTANLLDDVVPGGRIFEGLAATAADRQPDQQFSTTAVFGPGNDRIANLSQPIVIELGGDDEYEISELSAGLAHRTRIILDLAGADRYNDQTGALSSGSGATALFVDGAGNDTYAADERGWGSAVLGCSVLWDQAGNDHYRGQRHTQGFACLGIGLLIDRSGDDDYQSGTFSQGVGLAGGCGAILDFDGQDQYRCTGLEPSHYGDAGEFAGMGQGIGWGIRWGSAGGVGVLLDLAGDDRYSAGQFGLGCGYCYGIGILADRAGNDQYECSRYGLGTAAHFGIGMALDDGGDDQYLANRQSAAAELGSSWDLSLGMLIDAAGDDEYVVSHYALAGAAQNAYGLFWDKAGRDLYRSTAPNTDSVAGYAGQATYGCGRRANNLAVFLDDGGCDDAYHLPGRTNNSQGVTGQFGIWVDR